MIEVWKKDLRAFSKSPTQTMNHATVRQVYFAIVSMGSAIDKLQTRRGAVGQQAKIIVQLTSQL